MSPPAPAPGDEAADAEADALAAHRRALPVLSLMQVLGGVGVASGIAVNGLLGEQLSGSRSLSGVAQTMAVIGAAALAVPLARLASSRGRRPALTAGFAIAAAGAAVSILSGVTGHFWLLLVGTALFGGGQAASLQSRYAAIDAAPPSRRGRSLSLIMWAGTVGSVLGPNLSDVGGRVGRAVGITTLTGPYLFSLSGFVVAAVVCGLWLRPDPLLAARAHEDARAGAAVVHLGLRAAAAAATRSRAVVLGLVTVGTAHAVMVAVMVMTPVHLHSGGTTLRVIGLVISAHIAGMYVASPVMGWLVDRIGARRAVLVGIGVLLSALATAATSGPTQDVRLGVGLTLLGLGWSACVVAGSTLVSTGVGPQVRTAVQGLSDLVMGVVAAAAGALAGPVLSGWGYPALALCAAVVLVPTLVLAVAAYTPPPPAATPLAS